MIKKGFTLIELLLVIGIIAILSSVVIVAINPTKQLTDSENARRNAHARSIRSSIGLYEVENTNPPEGITATAQQICSYNAADQSTCLSLDVLIDDGYMTTFEQDRNETNANHLGYTVLQDIAGFYVITPVHLDT